MAAAAEFVRYEAPAAGADAAATRAARAAHNLIVQTEEARTELRAKAAGLPFEGAWALASSVVAEIVLDHVTAGDDLLEQSVGAHYFSETAWDRWLAAVMSLASTAGGALALPLLRQTVEKAVASAPDAVKQALIARASDLERCQSEAMLPLPAVAIAAVSDAIDASNDLRTERAYGFAMS